MSESELSVFHQYYTQSSQPNEDEDDTFSDDGENDNYDESFNSHLETKVENIKFEIGDTIRVELRPTNDVSFLFAIFIYLLPQYPITDYN